MERIGQDRQSTVVRITARAQYFIILASRMTGRGHQIASIGPTSERRGNNKRKNLLFLSQGSGVTLGAIWVGMNSSTCLRRGRPRLAKEVGWEVFLSGIIQVHVDIDCDGDDGGCVRHLLSSPSHILSETHCRFVLGMAGYN